MIIGYLQVAGMPNSGLEANAVADEWHCHKHCFKQCMLAVAVGS